LWERDWIVDGYKSAYSVSRREEKMGDGTTATG
jgi:hypothetical protein